MNEIIIISFRCTGNRIYVDFENFYPHALFKVFVKGKIISDPKMFYWPSATVGINTPPIGALNPQL